MERPYIQQNHTAIQPDIMELRRLEELKDALMIEIKEREDNIKKYMIVHNLDELHGLNGEKAIYREVLSNRFDSTSFKKTFNDLYNAYLKQTKCVRFSFSF